MLQRNAVCPRMRHLRGRVCHRLLLPRKILCHQLWEPMHGVRRNARQSSERRIAKEQKFDAGCWCFSNDPILDVHCYLLRRHMPMKAKKKKKFNWKLSLIAAKQKPSVVQISYLPTLRDEEQWLWSASQVYRLKRNHPIDSLRNFDFGTFRPSELFLVVQTPYVDSLRAIQWTEGLIYWLLALVEYGIGLRWTIELMTRIGQSSRNNEIEYMFEFEIWRE